MSPPESAISSNGLLIVVIYQITSMMSTVLLHLSDFLARRRRSARRRSRSHGLPAQTSRRFRRSWIEYLLLSLSHLMLKENPLKCHARAVYRLPDHTDSPHKLPAGSDNAARLPSAQKKYPRAESAQGYSVCTESIVVGAPAYACFALTTAWAAARRAIGTRNGEQET
jgi:hypothetical protein